MFCLTNSHKNSSQMDLGLEELLKSPVKSDSQNSHSYLVLKVFEQGSPF